jgi:Cell Wall Hydrolase
MRRAKRHSLIAICATLFVVAVTLALAIGTSIAPPSPSLVLTPDGRILLPDGIDPLAMLPEPGPELDPEDARALNAAQPFVTGSVPAALPFLLVGEAESRARALDCMAAAVLYEAGDDAMGQRSVAQVVINRARHPAYPKTICGVVFQGSERSTGCQFTFTCDGALSRRYSDDAWNRARATALAMLSGEVYRPVGLATHYHTDWVHPTWSSSLEKLARVGTHLFFRIPGYWGTPAAMQLSIAREEPAIARLAPLSPVHAATLTAPELALLLESEAMASEAITPAAVSAAVSNVIPRADVQLGDTIILTLDRSQSASFAALAEAACGTRAYCKVMGWTNPALAPASETMSGIARAAMSFSYLRDEQRGLERALWNCEEFARDSATQCMRR